MPYICIYMAYSQFAYPPPSQKGGYANWEYGPY